MRDDPNAYLDTLNRMEPDIHPVDASAFYASAAISLRRIADSLERLSDLDRQLICVPEYFCGLSEARKAIRNAPIGADQ